MATPMRMPNPPEKQEPLDLGELHKYRAGEYIKIEGRWYFISELDFVSRADAFNSLSGASALKRADEISLTLLAATWKKDDQ